MADELRLPTQEEIATLPRWARVAFAARCARRALPLFKQHWPDAPVKYFRAVQLTVSLLESSAADAAYDDDGFDDAIRDDAHASSVAALAATAYHASDVARAAHTACAAAAAAARAAQTTPTISIDFVKIEDAATAQNAAYAIAHVARAAKGDHSRFVVAINRDFKTLQDTARTGRWTKRTPVPPSVFGPLWPAEIPPYAKLAVKALVKPGVPPARLRDGLVELYKALNEYHQASGAGVLTLEDFRRFVHAESPVAVEV